jgi:hypothetical protein
MIYLAGILMMLSTFVISVLSPALFPGSENITRPLCFFLVLEVSAFGAYLIGIRAIRGQANHLRWILLVAVFCRLIFFGSAFILEDDPFRYIWDGQAVVQGQNPYEYSPENAYALAEKPARDLNAQGEFVYAHVNYPHVPTIYPPVAQGFFAAAQWISPWHWFGLEILIFGVELLILFVLVQLLKVCGRNPDWVLIYAWSPLVLKEFSNSIHVDVVAVLFLSCFLLFWAKSRFLWSAAALSMACGVKIFPILLLPVMMIGLWKHQRRAAATLYGMIFMLTQLLIYIPFMAGEIDLFEGLFTFAHHWQVNDSIFSLIHAGTSLLSDPSTGNFVARALVGCLIGFLMLISATKMSQGIEIKRVTESCVLITAGIFFLAPTGNPWYFTWVIPFLVLLPLRSLIAFSGLVFLYYVDFSLAGPGATGMNSILRLIEYGIFYGLVIWEIKTKPSPLFSLSATKAV